MVTHVATSLVTTCLVVICAIVVKDMWQIKQHGHVKASSKSMPARLDNTILTWKLNLYS